MNLAQSMRRRGLSVLLLVGVALLSAAGCSSSESKPTECEAACRGDERCIAGACRAPCSAQSDCDDDVTCSRWRFADESEGLYCAPLDGQFVACDSDDACDTEAGFRCADGECRFPCRSHFECASVGYCGVIADGHYCVRDAPAEAGGYYSACPNGAADCDASAGFACIGAGPGDLDAYCTTDCASDDDCPRGFQCGSIGAVPCVARCGVAGDPDRADCAPPEQIGAGLRFECGPLGVVRRVCEKRGFCSRCTSDDDCQAVPGQICAQDESGEKICTVRCDPSHDSCPWGNAARCGVWDESVGSPTCSHRFGSCRGQGRGCEPCVDDEDCGGRGFCARFSFTGERYCIDLGVECDCGADVAPGGTCVGGGCPDSPGGLAMTCFASRGATDAIGNRCISASSSSSVIPTSSPQAGCWRRL